MMMMPPAARVEPSGCWGNLSIYTMLPNPPHTPPRHHPNITPPISCKSTFCHDHCWSLLLLLLLSGDKETIKVLKGSLHPLTHTRALIQVLPTLHYNLWSFDIELTVWDIKLSLTVSFDVWFNSFQKFQRAVHLNSKKNPFSPIDMLTSTLVQLHQRFTTLKNWAFHYLSTLQSGGQFSKCLFLMSSWSVWKFTVRFSSSSFP